MREIIEWRDEDGSYSGGQSLFASGYEFPGTKMDDYYALPLKDGLTLSAEDEFSGQESADRQGITEAQVGILRAKQERAKRFSDAMERLSAKLGDDVAMDIKIMILGGSAS